MLLIDSILEAAKKGQEQVISIVSGILKWPFEEQGDLLDWVEVLKKLNVILDTFVESHPGNSLIDKTLNDKMKDLKQKGSDSESVYNRSADVFIVNKCEYIPAPAAEVKNIIATLKFYSILFDMSRSKEAYDNADSIIILLHAWDEELSQSAANALNALVRPSHAHRQPR